MSIAFASSAESPAGSVCIPVRFVFRRLIARLSVGHWALMGCPLAVDFGFLDATEKHMKSNA